MLGGVRRGLLACMPTRELPLCFRYSPDGSRMLSCGVDRSCRALRLPVGRYQGEGSDLMGHNGPVTCANWAHNGQLVSLPFFYSLL